MTAFESVSIIGAGAWGTALAIIAARSGCKATLWARRPEQAARIGADRENADHFSGIELPTSIAVTGQASRDFAGALDADLVLYAQPAQHFRAFCRMARPIWRHGSPQGTPLLICAKGIERDSGLLLNEIAEAELPQANVAILSGPSFARDAAYGLPTAVVIAGRDEPMVEAAMAALSNASFRPYGHGDPVGVEVAGAVKNVLAIACGMVIGRGLGENARAALIARGLAEMSRLALAKGGRADTMMGLAGLGDLVLTCSSMTSRNMSLGVELGGGRQLAEILATRNSIAEGVPTAAAVATLAAKLGVDMPISAAVLRILNDGASIDDEVRALLARPLKRED
jgi:glycerol-3-phosphate dehydrogenase (NAD(P)+)